jgi:toxoflavin synthase
VAAEYDNFAEEYKASKILDCFEVLDYAYYRRIGDVKNLDVLDLACGEGHNARDFKKMGCSRIVGVDISQAMINLALNQELEDRLGIEYLCENVAKIEILGSFDLVVGAHLLHYANSVDELHRFARNILGNVKDNGRAVMLNDGGFPDKIRNVISPFGWKIKPSESPVTDGSAYQIALFDTNDAGKREQVEFTCHFYLKETYDKVFKDVGFRQIVWHKLEVPLNFLCDSSKKHWKTFPEETHLRIIELFR